MRWGNALNLSFRDVFSSSFCFTKYTDYMLIHLEFSGEYPHISASLGWTLRRNHVVNLWWFVVVVRHIIVSVVLVVQSDIDSCDRDVIDRWRCLTNQFSRIYEGCWHFLLIQIPEDTESVICVVNDGLIDEGMQIRSHESDVVATNIWTIVGIQLGNQRRRVVPVVNQITRVLLLVH